MHVASLDRRIRNPTRTMPTRPDRPSTARAFGAVVRAENVPIVPVGTRPRSLPRPNTSSACDARLLASFGAGATHWTAPEASRDVGDVPNALRRCTRGSTRDAFVGQNGRIAYTHVRVDRLERRSRPIRCIEHRWEGRRHASASGQLRLRVGRRHRVRLLHLQAGLGGARLSRLALVRRRSRWLTQKWTSDASDSPCEGALGEANGERRRRIGQKGWETGRTCLNRRMSVPLRGTATSTAVLKRHF